MLSAVAWRRRTVVRAAPGEAIAQRIADAVAARTTGPGIDAYELPIVVACRAVIADTVAQLPMRELDGGYPVAASPITLRPDPTEPRWLTFHRATQSLTRHGRFYVQPTAYDAAGYPIAARVLPGDEVALVFDTAGRPDHAIHQGRRFPVGIDGLVWVPFDVDRPGDPGRPPLERCRRAVDYLCALWDMAGSFWEAGFPSVAVRTDHRLSDTDAARLKAQLLTAWARRHEPAVIDQGATLEQVGTNAVEAQLVESIAVANAEVARAFSVSPSVVNVAGGDSLTYSTVEGELSRWLALGLAPYLTRIEAAWTELRTPGRTCRFDTAELTRADFATRANAYATALGYAPWITPDEVRAREGLRPLTTVTPSPVESPVDADPPGVPR